MMQLHILLCYCSTLSIIGPSVPDSLFFNRVSIATLEVILISLLVAIGLIIAIALLIFNIIWRNNK